MFHIFVNIGGEHGRHHKFCVCSVRRLCFHVLDLKLQFMCAKTWTYKLSTKPCGNMGLHLVSTDILIESL